MWLYLVGAIIGYLVSGVVGLLVGVVLVWGLMWFAIAIGILKPEEPVSAEDFRHLVERVDELEERLEELENPQEEEL